MPNELQARHAPCLSAVVSGMWDEGGKGRPNEILFAPIAVCRVAVSPIRRFAPTPRTVPKCSSPGWRAGGILRLGFAQGRTSLAPYRG